MWVSEWAVMSVGLGRDGRNIALRVGKIRATGTTLTASRCEIRDVDVDVALAFSVRKVDGSCAFRCAKPLHRGGGQTGAIWMTRVSRCQGPVDRSQHGDWPVYPGSVSDGIHDAA